MGCVMSADIVGRDQELAYLDAFLDGDGRKSRAVVLQGEAGIGKSTLWLAGVETARDRGFRVLLSRPSEAERELAFTGLGDVLESVLDDVLPVLPAPRRRALETALLIEESTDAVDPRAVGVAVRSALEILASQGALMLAIDDVQWLDPSSEDALSFALRRLHAPLLVLLARRMAPGIEPSNLEHALAANAVAPVRVGPLSVGAIQTLLRGRLDRVFARPTLLRIHRSSGGNPMYALEIALALDLEVDPTQPLPVPQSLEDIVAVRLASLPERTRDALVLAAAHGSSPMALLTSAGIAETVLEPAFSAGVVELARGEVRFTHPLLAAVLYQRVSEESRRGAHGLLAGVVVDSVERAHHIARAAAGPDRETAASVEAAAELASARGALAIAIQLREHALRLTPLEAEEEIRSRMIAAARAHLATGDLRRAEDLAEDLLGRSPPGRRRAEALVLSSYVASGLPNRVALRREALAEAREDPALQASIQLSLGWDVRFTEGLHVAEQHARAALALSEMFDDPMLHAGALATLSAVCLHQAQPDALTLAERAYELARPAADREQVADVTLTVSSTLIWMGHLERATQLLEPLELEWSNRDETVTGQIWWRLAFVELAAGRLGVAAEHAQRAWELVREYERRDIALPLAVALVAAWRGDLDGARELAELNRPRADDTPWFVPHFQTVLGLVARWSGDPGRAVEHFAIAEMSNRALGSLEPSLARWRADYVEALLELGRLDEAVAILEPWEADAARLGREPVLAQTTRCRGLVAAARGDVDEALFLLEQAAARHGHVGDRLGRARALLALGIVRRRARKKRAAREAIETAVAIFEECGAEVWAEKARSELGRIGGRSREEGLTAAERRVAALVAEGRTNREVATALFLGERTVETHLSHIYAKLGVRSRTELARVYTPSS